MPLTLEPRTFIDQNCGDRPRDATVRERVRDILCGQEARQEAAAVRYAILALR